MAIDLVAKLRLQDDFSKPLQKATKSMDNAEKVSGRLAKSSEKLNRTFTDSNGRLRDANGRFVSLSKNTTHLSGNIRGLTNNMSGLLPTFSPVSAGFAAIAGAAGAAYGAVKIFNATVGKAMDAQVGEISIGAMFETPKETENYLKMIKGMALDSPVLSFSDMSGGSKKLLTLTRDAKMLEKTWKNVEKLQAYMPEKSTEEALRGIAELASGDIVSLKEVFNLDKTQLNALKELSFEEQVSGLEKMLNGMKITDEFIAKIGDTASAKWNQVKEKFDSILTAVGKPSLDALSNFFDNVLSRLEGPEMQKFAEWGGKAINSMVTGLSDSAIRLYDWFTQLTNDPEFQKRTTLTGKINFIIDDVAKRLQEWYDGGGKDKIIKFGSDVAQVLVSAMDATPQVFELGAKLGDAVWQGVIDGVKKSAAESPVGKVINGYFSNTPLQLVKKGFENAKNSPILKGLKENDTSLNFSGTNSHYHGIDYVPRNQYPASLHKGEAVLNAKEAEAWRNGQSGGGSNVTVTGNQFIVRQDSDIDAIAASLADKLERKMMQRG